MDPRQPLEVVDEIDITTSTVRWSAGQIDKLRVVVRNVTLDPGVVATVYARPVELEGEIGQATFGAWLRSAGVAFDIVLDGEGTATAHPRLAALGREGAGGAGAGGATSSTSTSCASGSARSASVASGGSPSATPSTSPPSTASCTSSACPCTPAPSACGHIPVWRERVQFEQVLRRRRRRQPRHLRPRPRLTGW